MNNTFHKCCLLFFMLSFVGSHAQTGSFVDSLLIKLNNSKTPKEKIITLNRLGYELIDYDNTKAYNYAEQALALAEKENYTKGQTTAINSLALINKERGNYSMALDQLHKALNICQLKNDSAEIARCYHNIGDVFKVLKSQDKAIIYFKLAYEVYDKLNEKIFAIVSLNKMAHTYMDQAEAKNDTAYILKALLYYNKALYLSNLANNNGQVTIAYINLANAYNKLGISSNNKNYLFKSLDFSMRSLRLSKDISDNIHQGISLANIAEAYQSLKEPKKALTYHQQALKLFEANGENYWIMYSNSELGKIYKELKDYLKAIEFTNTSIKLAKKQNLKDVLRDSYGLLESIYNEENNYSKAFEYRELADNYKDSMLNESSSLSIARLQTELESDRKDKKIELLNKNKEIQDQKIYNQTIFRNFLILTVVFLLILLLLVYNRYRVKQKAEFQILKAKETAEQAQEVQEQFLANTSHEIRTPMNGIIGMTHQLLDSPLNEEQLEYANAIKESSNNLLVIINDLLDLSKIKAGKMVFEKTPFYLADLFKNLIFTLQYRSTEKNIRLTSSIDEKIPEILSGDQVRLNQVLLNLAGNAIKFTEKGEVKIIAKLVRDDGKNVRILFSVQDTGIGIPDDKLDRIFESFTQINATTTRKYSGTGLGLTIAKQIVEQQGGTISLSSKVNEGSTFSFTLDFKRTKKKPKETNEEIFSESVIQNNDLSKVNVLVIDDNKVNQRVATLTLKKWKANVSIADDAKAGIELLKTSSFHIILMDISMPEMDGIEATQYIRKQMPAPICYTPIIAMTASALIGEREKCLIAGMNDYISKPFNPADLNEKIVRLLPKQMRKPASKLIDLTILNQRAEGDKEYLKEIFESYIAEMPLYITELKLFSSEKNITGIKRQVHKMKSPIALVGAQIIKKQLEIIEFNEFDGAGNGELAYSIEKINTECLQTIEEIKNELALLLKNNS